MKLYIAARSLVKIEQPATLNNQKKFKIFFDTAVAPKQIGDLSCRVCTRKRPQNILLVGDCRQGPHSCAKHFLYYIVQPKTAQLRDHRSRAFDATHPSPLFLLPNFQRQLHYSVKTMLTLDTGICCQEWTAAQKSKAVQEQECWNIERTSKSITKTKLTKTNKG